MRTFVDLNYDQGHQTDICGANKALLKWIAEKMQARNQILYGADEVTDSPDVIDVLDDHISQYKKSLKRLE
jgi:hypothetical protein